MEQEIEHKSRYECGKKRFGLSMIASLTGTVESCSETGVVLCVNGIGFEVNMSAEGIRELASCSSDELVHVHTYMSFGREGDATLFGFLTADELSLFKKLITVSGIGPKGALALLSSMSVDDLIFAILSGDAKSISIGAASIIAKVTRDRLMAEYDELMEAVENYKDKFETVKVAEPLLGEVGSDATVINDDKKAVAEILTAEAVKDSGYDSLDAAKISEFCPNITVNAILNSFYTKAQKNGISVSAEADIKENTTISDMDFVAVLSNLLENAVNGCIECNAGGEIKVNIRTVADKTVIVCSNPCREDICIENNMIKNRGIGIASILSSIRKYDGDIKYSYDNGILTVCIILNS